MNSGKYTIEDTFEIGPAKTVAAADMDVTNNNIRIPNHGYSTGDALGQVTTATITGVTSLVTPVYVIQVDASTIALATSRANAHSGTKAAITAAGTATFHKGGLGITLGKIIPSGHVIVNASYKVITTFASPTGVDNGTLAISVEGANDIFTATAINSGTTWDDAGMILGVPDLATVGDYVTTTADRNITFTTATDAITAGKVRVYLDVVRTLE